MQQSNIYNFKHYKKDRSFRNLQNKFLVLGQIFINKEGAKLAFTLRIGIRACANHY